MKTFILRDRTEFEDLNGNTEKIYILTFIKDRTAYELQDKINYYSSLYADYDCLYLEDENDLDEYRENEIKEDLEDLESCSCQFDYAINKLGKLYEDMEIECVSSNDMELWF